MGGLLERSRPLAEEELADLLPGPVELGHVLGASGAVGMEAPGNYGPDFKRDFDAMYPDLADAYGALLFPTFFAPLTDGTDQNDAVQRFMQPDGIHPNADGVSVIVNGMGPTVLELLERTHAERRDGDAPQSSD